MIICNCKDWDENIDKINAGFSFIHARNPYQESGYTGKKFLFCPFCGYPCRVNNQPATFTAFPFVLPKPVPYNISCEIICDHLCSGNACCPCGYYKNPTTKSGGKGIGIDKAHEKIKSEFCEIHEVDALKIMWERDWITGEEYISRLNEVPGGKRAIEAEKLK